MIKQPSKKNYEKFYKLLSKQEIRVLQEFYKLLKKSKIKQASTKASKQRKVLKTFKASKVKDPDPD